MALEVADEAELACITALGQHPEGVATDGKHTARLDPVVLVEREDVGMGGNPTVVDDGLSMVFAGIFEPIDGEQAMGGREEAQRTGTGGQLRIGDRQGPVAHEPWIGKAVALRPTRPACRCRG